MKLGICNDHSGVELKKAIVALLEKEGHNVADFGTGTTESVDYPDYAHKLATAIGNGLVEAGVAICGTGNGMAITLNHCKGIRAGLAWTEEIGALVKRHNDANVLVLSARYNDIETNLRITKAWLDSSFEGGRHARRIGKI